MQQFEVSLSRPYVESKAPAVSFDLEKISIEGLYSDQLAAYRAKKQWIEAFEGNFLLEHGHDFRMTISSDLGSLRFALRCEFLTACGRYAFWRLSHNQAPEVQFIVENAHLPATLDLSSLDSETEPLSQILSRLEAKPADEYLSWRGWLKKIVSGLQKGKSPF